MMGVKERREREKELRKNQILEAAKTLLLERGLKGTSVHQIAKKAELGVATIYSYYQNKEDLFSALQQEGLRLLEQGIQQACQEGKTPGDKIKKMAWAYYRFSQADKDYFDIINYFLSQPEVMFDREIKRELDHLGNTILSQVEKALQEGIDQKAFQKVDVKKSAIQLWGMLHGLLLFRKMKNTILRKENYKAIFEYALENFVSALEGSSSIKGSSKS
jgi:AcrR family transcriptional regulator